MKFILTLLFPLFLATTIYGQAITYDDFKTLSSFVIKEDFKSAFEKTDQLLGSTRSDSSEVRGIVTYMNIYSSAGMVALGEMTHDDFLKNAYKYVGHYVVMPAHPVIDKEKQGLILCNLTLRMDSYKE